MAGRPYRWLRIEDEGPARVLRLAREQRRNALSLELAGELVDALLEAEAAEAIRGVVITGSDTVFSAGADLKEARALEHVSQTLRWLAQLRRLTTVVETLSKPVVAAICGPCLTGGLELALACDHRVAGEHAQFGITSARIGTVAGMGGTQRLPRLVGPGRAKDLLMTARIIGAAEALAMGLVEKVVADEQVVGEAVAWVHLCAERAPLSVWMAKWAVNRGVEMDLGSALDFESLLTAAAFTTDDRQEGTRAWLEKRPPHFRGR